jgi:hypothetical protein
MTTATPLTHYGAQCGARFASDYATNRELHHVRGHDLGIGLMTPNQVHYGQADEVYAARQKILHLAFEANPQRFVNKTPQPPQKPTAVWINPPTQRLAIQA